jgi:hypothetical protein
MFILETTPGMSRKKFWKKVWGLPKLAVSDALLKAKASAPAF